MNAFFTSRVLATSSCFLLLSLLCIYAKGGEVLAAGPAPLMVRKGLSLNKAVHQGDRIKGRVLLVSGAGSNMGNLARPAKISYKKRLRCMDAGFCRWGQMEL